MWMVYKYGVKMKKELLCVGVLFKLNFLCWFISRGKKENLLKWKNEIGNV